MKTRFSPVALACAAVLSLMSMQVQAESAAQRPAQAKLKVPELTTDKLGENMTPSAARTYDALTSATMSALTDVKKPAGNVGTNGAGNGTNNGTNNGANNGGHGGGHGGANNPSAVNNGSSGNSTIAGTTNIANMAGIGSAVGMPGAGAIAGIVGSTNGIGAAGGTDWLKVVQVAAPVIAGLSGNAKVGQIAGIVGSGANVYGQISSGQDLTAANYANIGNIVLQASAVGSKDPNLLRAAQIGNVGVGVLNTYAAMTPNAASTAGGAMTQIGQTATGQAVYRTPSGATVVVAGVNASGQPIYQTATSSASQPSGPTWGPNAAGTQPARALGELLNTTNGRSYDPGSPGQQAAERAAMTTVNNTLDEAMAAWSTPTRSGQRDNSAGPADNYDLQNVPSGGVDNYDLQGRQPGSDVDNYDLQGSSANSTRAVSKPYRVTTNVTSKPYQVSSAVFEAEVDRSVEFTRVPVPTAMEAYTAFQAAEAKRLREAAVRTSIFNEVAAKEKEAVSLEQATRFPW